MTEPASLIAAYRSRELFEYFSDLPFVGAGEVVTHTGAQTVTNDTRWDVRLDLPAAARVFVDPDKLSFVEQMTLHNDGTGTFVVTPHHYAKLLRASGTTVIAAEPGGSGSTRTTEGTLKIDLGWKGKLLEGEVERIIANGLTEALHAQIPQVEHYIASV